MEGPDNDANKNPNSTTSGGIFSTPDLTVDANNLTQPTPSNDKNRIASLFANTKTGRESQRLNDAMGMNNINNPQPLEGDLVIQNNPKKKSKLPLFLIVAVLLVVVISVVAFVLLSKPATEQAPQTPLAAFEEYRNYMCTDPSENEENVSSDECFLVKLYNKELLNTDEKEEYISNLLNKYKQFETLFDKQNVISQDNIQNYSTLLNVTINSIMLDALSHNILTKFLQEGNEKAYSYIEETAPEVINSASALSMVGAATRAYLEKELSAIEIYSNLNCIKDNLINYSCGEENGLQNNSLLEIHNDQTRFQQIVKKYFPELGQELVAQTNSIYNKLEEQ